MNIYDLLELEEGFSPTPYLCSEGYPTIGYGTRIGTKDAPIEQYTFTVSKNTAKCMLEEHLKEVENYLSTKMLSMVSSNRYMILQSMVYQLGGRGLDGFKKMWKAIEDGDWEEASKQALDSKWAVQTPNRASRHAKVLLTGKWEGVYK
jgi:lysozyme